MSENKTFRCDDAAGFELRIYQANDGDFHVAVVPSDFCAEDHDEDDTNHRKRVYAPCYGASVRVRTPFSGGGSHEMLWHALARLYNGTAIHKGGCAMTSNVESKPLTAGELEEIEQRIDDDVMDLPNMALVRRLITTVRQMEQDKKRVFCAGYYACDQQHGLDSTDEQGCAKAWDGYVLDSPGAAQ